MTTYISRRLDWAHKQETSIAFNLRDERGRAIGATVTCLPCTWVDSEYGYTERDGVTKAHVFACQVQANRNGVCYGASQTMRHFTNTAERDAYAAAQVESMRKRYTRKYAANTSPGTRALANKLPKIF